jgi:hypothetical protein
LLRARSQVVTTTTTQGRRPTPTPQCVDPTTPGGLWAGRRPRGPSSPGPQPEPGQRWRQPGPRGRWSPTASARVGAQPTMDVRTNASDAVDVAWEQADPPARVGGPAQPSRPDGSQTWPGRRRRGSVRYLGPEHLVLSASSGATPGRLSGLWLTLRWRHLTTGPAAVLRTGWGPSSAAD